MVISGIKVKISVEQSEIVDQPKSGDGDVFETTVEAEAVRFNNVEQMSIQIGLIL